MRRDPLADPEPLIRQVYSYVAYRIGTGSDAEDVTGTVFERAVRYRRSFDSRRGTPSVWLISIARHVLAERHVAQYDELDPETPGETLFEQRLVERLDLREALSRLDVRDRELLALRYGADLDSHQIGLLLELTAGAVDVALHRARARLRAALEPEPVEQLSEAAD